VSHGRYVIFQIAEFAVARQTFQEISPAEFKTQVNPSHYAIFVRCNNLYCNAPKEMLFHSREELGCKSVQRSARDQEMAGSAQWAARPLAKKLLRE
jgi:hypothetical protein